MPKLTILLYSTAKNDRMTLSGSEEDLSEIWRTLERNIDIYKFMGHRGINAKNTEKTKSIVVDLVNKYGSRMPQLNRLKYLCNNLERDETFYIFDEEKSEIVFRKTAIECLYVWPHKDVPAVIHNHIIDKWFRLSFQFKIYSYGFDGLRISVGEKVKSKRVCRFCGQSGAEHFKEVAHAIQDSLGNNLLTCNEECDDCNHKLSSIEDNFLHVMDVRRSIFHISRKNSAKSAQVIGENFIIKPDVNGNAVLYLMDEKLPPKEERNSVFSYRLINKASLTNERVYMALVKMVIDLIPLEELPHLHNTIKWIMSFGAWTSDSLPSIKVANTGNFFEQPYLDLFVRRKEGEATPYCTAILWIYDLAYMFVVPFVDVDRGMYKYEADLVTHWDRMMHFFPYQWVTQNTSDWWEAYAWIDMDVDLRNDMICVLPESNSIFDPCRKKENETNDVHFKKFTPKNIILKSINAEFENLYAGRPLTDDDFRDITEHQLDNIRIFLNPTDKTASVHINMLDKDTTDTIDYFKYRLDVTFSVPTFNDYVNIDYNSFSLDYDFRNFLVIASLMYGEQRLASQRDGTQFEQCSLDRYASRMDIDRFSRSIIYHVRLIDGKVIIIPDVMIHRLHYE